VTTSEIVMLVGGIAAIAFAAFDAFDHHAFSLTGAAVVVLGVVFVLLAVL
jgi:hypothetical protein